MTPATPTRADALSTSARSTSSANEPARRRSLAWLCGSLFGPSLTAQAQVAILDGLSRRIEQIKAISPALLNELKVPGMSLALLQQGQIAWSGEFGVCEAGAPETVQANTVFEAASMSKPLFAYLVMQTVQAGLLDLDRPVQQYLPQEAFKPPQAWQSLITARHLLTHRSGLPNWRSAADETSQSLRIGSEPGQHFNYSGEGYFYLQRVLEQICAQPLQTLAESQLFKPLGMRHSSFVLTPELDALRARGHDDQGQVLPLQAYTSANAAYTFYTTAGDYAKFLAAMMSLEPSTPHGLKSPALKAMLAHATPATDREPIARPGAAQGLGVYWGLGWAINTTVQGDIAYHTGTNSTGFRCYSQFSPSRRSGFVLMSNGLNGHLLWRRLMDLLGDL
ncbi:serine hydrolase domain-containing protein [Paucibacter sp. Y2R2-4]|uniref:serine hydrolase domain-containing protein n=1 Tax=Paucibacter sp. Y2R2-4 TaxID=2893553 RepID=UPI0021E4E616|nr:serine hydrolase domain-containing protein [Paucibacter sp. Y2R2-4]MCV2351744.1 beta-lactamase family protein [Paucibacter sp. Y2R2-4]